MRLLVRGLLGITVAWCFTVLYWLPILALVTLSLRRLPEDFLTGAAHWWGRVGLALCGVRVVLDNPSTLTDRRARVVVMNHQSAFDLAWGAVVLPPGALALGKRELAYLPVINIAWWAFRFMLVDRAHPERARRSLAQIATIIRNDERSLLIAPEGTRSRTGEIGPFKPGAFRFAQDSGAPIYPVVVCGAFELLPRHRVIPRPGTLHLRFLPPIPTDGWQEAELPHHMESVRRQIVEAHAQMRVSMRTEKTEAP